MDGMVVVSPTVLLVVEAMDEVDELDCVVVADVVVLIVMLEGMVLLVVEALVDVLLTVVLVEEFVALNVMRLNMLAPCCTPMRSTKATIVANAIIAKFCFIHTTELNATWLITIGR